MPAVQRAVPSALAALLTAAMIFLPPPASGAAVVDVDFPACQPANRAMLIDGKIDDWRGIEGKQFLPVHAFDSVTMAENRPDLAATVRFTCDAESLYALVEWLSPTPPSNTTSPSDATDWQRGGDGIEFHLMSGGLLTHVASYPSVDGRKVALLVRREGEVGWRDMAAEHGAAALAIGPRGYVQELRIPWRALVRGSAPPTGRPLPIMMDLAWRALPAAALARLSEDLRRVATHFTYNVLINLCAWYDSARGQPALTADGKDLAHPLLLAHGAKASVCFGPGEYIMELAIPWRELFPGPAPRAGETLRATLQPWWSGLDPRFTLSGTLKFERRSPLAFAYTMPRDAEVTIGIYGSDGSLLRWLTRSEFRRAGPNTESWDGRDQDGKLMPPGEYAIKAIYHDPLGLEHQLSVGNPGTPPWSTTDGKGDWLGDESNPQAATTDGDWVYLASPCHEKGFRIVAVDGTGQRRWGGGSGPDNPRCVSLAVAGNYLYLVGCGPEKNDNQHRFSGKNADNRVLLRCYDKRTGAPARFTIRQPMLKVAAWPYEENMVGLWEFFNNKAFDPDAYGGLPRYGDCQYGEVAEAMGVAATADTVWISFHTQGLLRAFDAETGEARPERDIPVQKPVSLLARPDGSLLAVSGKQVVRIDPAKKIVTPVVTAGLAAPFGVAADKADNIYVSDWRDSFQVKVFSPAGRLLRSIGKPGGRAVLGKWEADGMLLPRGVAVTADGKLWVAEDDTTPRRVSVWDAANGALIRDYIGPTPYGGGSPFWFEPGDQTVLHTLGCRFKLDWAKKTWVPEASELRRMSHEQPFALCGANGMIHAVRTFARGGRHYAMVASGYDLVTIQMRDGQSWRPVAAAGTLHRWATDDGTGVSVWDSDVGAHIVKNFRPECFRGHIGENFAWSDRNNDGLVQPEEMTWQKTIFRGDVYEPGQQPEFLIGWGLGCDAELNLLLGGSCMVGGSGGFPLFRLAVEGWTAAGIPLYDIRQAAAFAITRGANGLYGDAHGNVLVAGGENTTADALACLDRSGKLLWRIAGKEKPRTKDPVLSNVSGELDLPGIGPAYGTWAWHGNFRAYLISADGLYIGTVQEDSKAGPAGLWDESWRFWYQTPNGTPYLVNGANQGQHILKVTGLDKAGRFQGRLTITPADTALAATVNADDSAPVATLRKPPIAVQWRETAPAIDGDLADWDLGYGTVVPLGNGRSATAVLARDEANLYLAWQVEDDSPLKNLGTNWQTLFVSGDCVDLMLATDSAGTRNRTAPAAGDLRLLLSVFQDNPVAVLYRPVIPGATDPVQLMAVRLDRIDLLDQAKVAVTRGTDAYTIEAAVPLAALGLATSGIDTLRGDLGVISSDPAGRDRVKRSYHYNTQTEMTADLTTEATLQPGEWGEVRFPLGKNLIRDGGFENGFAANVKDGWAVTEQTNGMKVTTSPLGAHSGQRGLVFRQTVPLVYPPEVFMAPDYRDFLKAANGGKGGGGGVVAQRVPVEGGKKYSLRFWYRTEGTKGDEVKVPSQDRGYTALHVAIDWLGPNSSHTGILSVYDDRDWARAMNSGTHALPTPYTAPAKAEYAVIMIRASINAPNFTPAMMVDDVEFVEADR